MEFLEYGIVLGAVLLGAGVWLGFRKKKTLETSVESERSFQPEQQTVLKPNPYDRLDKTKGSIFSKLSQLINKQVPDTLWEELEEVLLSSDIGFATTQVLLERCKKSKVPLSFHSLKQQMMEILSQQKHGFDLASLELSSPRVISIVGVNGVGKTTTIGKLAQFFSHNHRQVLLGAGDTFRAAAIDQLRVWSERTQSDFVTGREGGDPGAVAFDAVSAGQARKKDVVLLDTAGRLHTKLNLMEELKKVMRVIKKVIPDAPHETWLVLDGTTGQNMLAQAQEFQKTLPLTGLIITKLDGTAKGGAILGVSHQLGLPIKFVGLGEQAEDLVPFSAPLFLDSIIPDPS